MGCSCCRMIKSYIYDPSLEDDHRKSDPAGGGTSYYQSHHLPGMVPTGGGGGSDASTPRDKQKQGFHNLGYSKSSDSTLKLEVDNNQVNQRLHAAPSAARELHQPSATAPPPPEGGLYIIQPDAQGPRWMIQERTPSQVPVYPNIHNYGGSYGERDGRRPRRTEWDDASYYEKRESLSAEDEVDEGVGGTPEYTGDTGDEGSVLSVDVHTSSTSLSSADTRDGRHRRAADKTPDASTMESGISVTKGESDEEEEVEEEEGVRKVEEDEEEEEEEVQSVTDSMVAEALAALEAATAGEDVD